MLFACVGGLAGQYFYASSMREKESPRTS
jgi:hypothetical protein